MAAPQRHQPQGVTHLRGRVAQHAPRGLPGIDAEASSEPGEGLLGRFGIQGHGAAEEVAWIESARDQVRIGQRRLGPAAVVTGRARVRPGAPRSHMQPARRVRPDDRPAARADLDDLDGGRLHRIPRQRGGGTEIVLGVDSYLPVT